MKSTFRAMFILAAVFFGHDVLAVSGKVHCYKANHWPLWVCNSSAYAAGRAAIESFSPGLPFYPERPRAYAESLGLGFYFSDGYCDWNGWASWDQSGGGPIMEAGRWYRQGPPGSCPPTAANDGYSTSGRSENLGYSTQIQEPA